MPEPTQEQCAICLRLVSRDGCRSDEEARSDGSGCQQAQAECYHLGYKRLAAEAAPLREEIERLGREKTRESLIATNWAVAASDWRKRAEVAEATVLSLEAEIERQHELYVGAADDTQHERRKALILEKQLSEEHLKGEACTLDWAEKLDAALAAASRAREEQGALRAALEAVQYSGWDYSEQNGCAVGVCPTCSRHLHASDCGLAAALAPPAAESQEKPLTCRQLVPSQYGYFGKCGFSPESHECGNPLPCPTHSPQENQQQLTGKGAK